MIKSSITTKRINHYSLTQTLSRDFKINKYKYLIILPIIVYLILFAYKPMYGIIIAFMDYRPHLGIANSKWVGLRHFKTFLTMYISGACFATLYPSVGLIFCLVSRPHYSGTFA